VPVNPPLLADGAIELLCEPLTVTVARRRIEAQ
jgi:hypothetical protein